MNSDQDWDILLRDKAINNRRFISYHIFSLIWSSVKSEYDVNLPQNVISNLNSTISVFIFNFNRSIPSSVQLIFPQLNQLVWKVTIPYVPIEDIIVWKHTSSSDLSLKEA